MTKKEIILKLIENARDPKYTKHKEWFKSTRKANCYCIEGLLLETLRKDFGKGEWSGKQFILEKDWHLWANITGLDFRKICREFENEDISFFAGLMCKNDTTDITFPEMADLIEQHYGYTV